MGRPSRSERGAALLTAMVIVTLVATLAAAMVWQQWRAVQVEAAERARAQAQWILTGAIDWARLILREDARTGGADHLGEPWAVPLAEAKLSTFLAADKDNTDDAPEAFLSGSIADVTGRYNLRHLIEATTPVAELAEQKTLQSMFEAAGVSGDLAARVAAGLRQAAPIAPTAPAAPGAPADAASGTIVVASSTAARGDAPLLPERIDQLVWLGVDPASIALLEPYLTLLPVRTPVNVNTAPKEVLAGVLGIDLSSAERIVQARQRKHFRNIGELQQLLPQGTPPPGSDRLSTSSSFFEVRGRLRLDDRIVEERALVERRNLEIVPLRRQRVAGIEALGSEASR
ncbi:MAG TPA: type II secretion system minor pseudopilin GspK [Methylibium sp.]|uniref:type II secretion system minor pseudopilin GspK n=1 Tax=Methylibium sp. TaxID=2067992 RepID=UPI002DBC074D|nr:type II secretion system minor pseudopilin GspK [Methylibium sp.]HEU4459199.1 type II secretion system minor pseudopilin GspK [Methylibium sp.]